MKISVLNCYNGSRLAAEVKPGYMPTHEVPPA
jgi:hypothetical protein